MVGSERRSAGSAHRHPGGASFSLVYSRVDEKLEHSAPDPPFPSSSFLEVNFGACRWSWWR